MHYDSFWEVTVTNLHITTKSELEKSTGRWNNCKERKTAPHCWSYPPSIPRVPKLCPYFTQAAKNLSSCEVLSVLYSHTPLFIIRLGGFGAAAQPQKHSKMAPNFMSRLCPGQVVILIKEAKSLAPVSSFSSHSNFPFDPSAPLNEIFK